MIRRPFKADWDMSQLPTNRQEYLECTSFEQMATRIASESKITHISIARYKAPARGEPKDARQVVFRFCVSEQACDIFFNAPDGLRGRYWQSPDHGFVGTRHLIDELSARLRSYAENNPPKPCVKAAPMELACIAASISAPSAKIWLRERDDKDEPLLVEPTDQLIIPRWIANESHGALKGMWRRMPKGGEMEVKGAILGVDGTEYVPNGKRDRSCQIHHFGFT